MSIWIIRHGETAGNANRVVQTPDTPLSQRGLAQASLLAQRLAGEKISRVLASDYPRAAMTAQALGDAIGVPVESDPLLRERNFGVHRGTPYAELSVDLFGPGYAPPGGEDWDSFHARVDRAWQRIREARGGASGDVAVVTHGLVLHSLVTRHLRLPEWVEPVFGFGNTSVTRVGAEPPWLVSLQNCTAHLDERSANDEGGISGI